MQARSKRLPREEFQARGYRTARTPYFLLKMKPNGGKGMRAGIVAGKSVHKTAARRNFWKRQARAGLVRTVRGDRDVLLVLNTKVNGLTRRQFQESLVRAHNELE